MAHSRAARRPAGRSRHRPTAEARGIACGSGCAVTAAWGEAPGELFVDRSNNPDGEIVAATLQAGKCVILVQPPRGFGENPIAIYHDPDLAPSHHYLACIAGWNGSSAHMR